MASVPRLVKFVGPDRVIGIAILLTLTTPLWTVSSWPAV